MEDQLVSLETEILAKEKGFRVAEKNRLTQSLLQKWFREIHMINVESNYLSNIKKYRSIFKPMSIIPKTYTSIKDLADALNPYYGRIGYDTYEEALEEGLKNALKLIV